MPVFFHDDDDDDDDDVFCIFCVFLYNNAHSFSISVGRKQKEKKTHHSFHNRLKGYQRKKGIKEVRMTKLCNNERGILDRKVDR